jgi:radical SAM protein with 4Fe4S-binding SPASM domain
MLREKNCATELYRFFAKIEEIGFFKESPEPKDSTESPETKNSNLALGEVYLNVTNKCNMSCPYCYMSADKYSSVKEMTHDQITGVIDQIHRINKNSHIIVSGGEPLLRRDIYDILSYLHERQLPSTLITNGSMVSVRNVHKLSTLNMVQVSVDGSNAQVHERTRNNFDAVWAGVQVLVDHKIPLVVAATISAHNYDDIPALTEKCRLSEIDISYCLVEPFGRANKHDNLTVSPKKVFDLLSRLSAETPDASQGNHAVDFANYYKRRCKRRNCGMGKGIISIAANGDVFPCHVLHRKELTMGNLLEVPLEEVLQSEDLGWTRVDVDEIEGCGQCDYKYLCGGGCRAHTYWKYGTFRKRYPYCELSSRCIEYNLTQGNCEGIV